MRERCYRVGEGKGQKCGTGERSKDKKMWEVKVDEDLIPEERRMKWKIVQKTRMEK